METIALENTCPLLIVGVPGETKQIMGCDVFRQVAAVNSVSELDLTKIEGDFLRGVLQDQAELNWIDERVQESEWYLFLENLSPVTPRDSTDLEECEFYKERRPSGDSSFREWDVLLHRLSQMETDVVQQILGHVELDVLQGMLDYLHNRMIRDNVQETEREDSVALPDREFPSKKPHNKPVQDETENDAAHSFHVLGLHKHIDSDMRSMTNPILEERHGTMDWLRWPKESIPLYTKSRCSFLKDIGEQVSSDQLGNSSKQIELKLEATFERFPQQQQVPQNLLPKSSEHDEPDQKDIFKQLTQNMESESEPAFQGLKQQQLPQNFHSKSFSQGEIDQKEVNGEMLQQRESEPESDLDPGSDVWQTLNLDFRHRCSQQIESKLAEIPCQIASTLFMRTPQNIDSGVLHQLFRQIGTIVFQVMPQQILFDSIQPKDVEAHLFEYLRPVSADYSLQRLDDGLENTGLNKLELLKRHRWHHLQSLVIQNLQHIPPESESTNGSKQRDLEKTPFDGNNQSLDYHEVDRGTPSCQNDQYPWSSVFQYSTAIQNHLQLLPEFFSNSCSRVGGTWNPSTIQTEPCSLFLDMLPPSEMIDNRSLPTLYSAHCTLDSVLSSEVILPDISPGEDSSRQLCVGLPGEQLVEEAQNCLFPLASTDSVHLVPQSFMEIPFAQKDPIEAHPLHQQKCLSVLQQIAEQVEYNISQGLPVEINSDLLQALDLHPKDYWLQPPWEEARHDYIYHHPDTSWEVQDEDVESDTCPEPSQLTENSKDSGELHKDINSSSGWTTEPSDAESPRYYMADPVFKVYQRRPSYKDVDVNMIRQNVPNENLHYKYETPNQSVPEAMMPMYASPLNSLEDVRRYIEMVALGDKLQDTSKETEFDHFDPSPSDYMSSSNMLWITEDELRRSQATEQLRGGGIGHSLDFHVNRLGGTASDLAWVLDRGEGLNLAEAPQDQLDDIATYLGDDFSVSGDIQVNDLLASTVKQIMNSQEAEGSSLERSDSNSQSSQSHGSGSSLVEAQQLQGNAQLDGIYRDCCQPQLPDSAKMDLPVIDGMGEAKQRNSVELNPQIASVLSHDGLQGKDSGPSLNPNHSDDVSATSNRTESNLGVNNEQRSEIYEEPQVSKRGGPKLSSPRNDVGKPWQAHTSSSNEDSMHQGASPSESPKGCSSMVKLTKRSTSQSSPTLSQFHDPSTHVRHTIFGLLVLAGGLYLVENRDAIEQHSMSATEAASEAWRWLRNFLIRMARGEFDN